ncbi:MAG: hypothetical protein EBT27_09700, partial [Betaproteobacteria bacterium]|nr:hypothetical protein [Betaproteobacteria bacterium]
MVGEPVLIDPDLHPGVAAADQPKRHLFNRMTRALQQRRQTKCRDLGSSHRMPQHRRDFAELAAMPQHQRRQRVLLGTGESGHVRIAQDVRRVLVVAGVRHRQAQLVQIGCPPQLLAGGVVVAAQVIAQYRQSGPLHRLRLHDIHLVTTLELLHGHAAQVFFAGATKHVVEDALAHRTFSRRHALDAKGLEHR